MTGHAPQQTPPDSSSSSAPERAVCSRCRRPQRVCLCAALPAHPIRLAGHVVILQHPHETKLKLATVPVLQQCLSPESLTVIVGRRLKCGEHPAVDQLLQCCKQRNTPILLLWPGPGATCITDVAIPGIKQQQPLQQSTPAQQQQQQHQHQQPSHPQQQQQSTFAQQQQPVPTYQQQQQQEQRSIKTQEQESIQAQQHSDHQPQPLLQASPRQADCASQPPAYVLLVVDSTWRYAREMFDALKWIRQPRGPAVQVTLPGQAAAGCAAAGSSTTSSSSSSGSRSSTKESSATSNSSSGVVLNGIGSSCCKAGLGDCTDVPACASYSLTCSQSQHQQVVEQQHSNKASRMQHFQQECHNSCTSVAEAAAYGAKLVEPQGATQQQIDMQLMQPDQPAEQQHEHEQQHEQQPTVQKQRKVQKHHHERLSSQQPHQLAPGVQAVPVAVADPVDHGCSVLNGSSSSSMGSPSCTVESNVLLCPSLSGVSCRLRTEPHESCCTTYEAVARAVSCLEGSELLPILLQPLQLLTALQAQFDPAIRQRMQQGSSGVVNTKSKLGMRNQLAAMKL